jgi:hypothetical protein
VSKTEIATYGQAVANDAVVEVADSAAHTTVPTKSVFIAKQMANDLASRHAAYVGSHWGRGHYWTAQTVALLGGLGQSQTELELALFVHFAALGLALV